MIDYLELVKKSFQIAFKHKYLWIFGLFAGYGITTTSLNFSSSTNYDITSQDPQAQKFFQAINDYLTINWTVVLYLLIFIVFIAFLVYFASILSQSALVLSIRDIEDNKKVHFWFSLHRAKSRFWALLWYKIVIFFIYLFIILGTSSPLLVFLVTQQWILSILYGLILFFFILFIFIVLNLSARYGLRFVVLKKITGFKALLYGWRFLKQFYKEVLILWLLQFAIGLGAAIITLIFILCIGLLSLGLGFAFYSIWGLLTALIYGGVIVLLAVVCLAIWSAFLSTFNWTIPTLLFLKLQAKLSKQ